jgi:hypothetical protein
MAVTCIGHSGCPAWHHTANLLPRPSHPQTPTPCPLPLPYRSLFEKDKLLFSLLLCVAIKAHISHSLHLDQFRFLLTGGISTSAPPPNPSTWLSDRSWAELCRLAESFSPFAALPADFTAQQEPWKVIYDCADPAAAHWPQPCTAQLDSFQRLLLLRVFRPDKLVAGIQHYVTEVRQAGWGWITSGCPGWLPAMHVVPPCFNVHSQFRSSAVNVQTARATGCTSC